jgi:hypothetical protein
MIQRIQTLFLLIAILLMGLIYWFPLAEIAVGEKIYSFTLNGITEIGTGLVAYKALHLIIFLLIIILIELVVIFSYKKRIRQMRMATYNLLLMAGFLLVSWLFVKTSANSLGDGIYSMKLPVAFPFVAAVLNYLAIRAIGRDEALVRSVDRIR